MAETLEQTPVAPVEPTPAPVEPPHVLPGTAPEPAPVDDDSPLDDVVDEDAHRPRGSRAKSKMAAARINRLTAERNELRQRMEALEKAQQPAEAKPVYRVPPVPTEDFNEPEPQLEQFADKDDPYGAWMRAQARWDRQKEAHEEGRLHQQAHVQQITRQQQDYWNTVKTTHQQRLMEVIQSNPDAARMLSQARSTVEPPPVLDYAIMLDEDSASVALFLASHPDLLDDFVLRTAPLPVTEQTVATTRRQLRKMMATAGTTGSVAPSQPLPNAPRPPNPVRTGTIRTGNEPPGDGSSIADHAKYYGPKTLR